MNMMHTLLLLSVWAVMGYLTGYMAKLKNRDVVFWFIMGVLFTLLAMVVLAMLPEKKSPRKGRCRVPKAANNSEVTEVHNEASLPFEDNQSKQESTPSRLRMPTSKDIKWYYINDKAEQVGPLKINELRKLASELTITAETYVWHGEMAEWSQLKGFSNYSMLFDPDFLEE